MTRTLKTILVLFVAVLLFPGELLAQNPVRTGIRVIRASSDVVHVDPGLRDIGPELTSIFKYTSYRLIKETSMDLLPGIKGRVTLPGGRVLEVLPLELKGSRIKYKITILKQGAGEFNTEVLLRNRGSVTIGGPRFENGYLLFNISGSSQ